jgi:hypothetical protein
LSSFFFLWKIFPKKPGLAVLLIGSTRGFVGSVFSASVSLAGTSFRVHLDKLMHAIGEPMELKKPEG